jgi:ribosome maturation factor RimP
MTQNTAIQPIEALVQKLIDGVEDIFLVSVRIKPINNIKVFLDSDIGVNIDKCARLNRAMYKVIEEEAWYPEGNFSLEVSSPGVDEPLHLPRQYKKNVGRNVEVTFLDDTKVEGKMMEANEEGIVVEYTEGKNKKAVVHAKQIAYSNMKQTIVQVSF